MRKVLAALAACSALAIQGASADPLHRWDGFYGGVNIGGTWGRADTDTSCSSSIPFACPFLAASGIPPSGLSTSTSSVIGGGQLGYNLQYGHWVFGGETDFSWTDADGSDGRNGSLFGFLPTSAVSTERLDWLGTVRGRVGWASGDLFVYGTGGFAYGKVHDAFTQNISFPGAPGPFFTATGGGSDIQTGWTVGGGAELALGRFWSVKGEYLFYDLGSQSFQAPWNLFGTPIPGSFSGETKVDGQIARVGLNYHIY